MIPLERVEGVELSEAFLEGFVGQLVRRELNEVHYLSCVCTAQSSGAVIKLCEAARKSSGSKLSFCLSKPYTYVVSPELRELKCSHFWQRRTARSHQL